MDFNPADLTTAKDARRAVMQVCIADTTRFVLRGIAGNDEPVFMPGERIHRTAVGYPLVLDTISAWFAKGRTITAISLYHI